MIEVPCGVRGGTWLKQMKRSDSDLNSFLWCYKLYDITDRPFLFTYVTLYNNLLEFQYIIILCILLWNKCPKINVSDLLRLFLDHIWEELEPALQICWQEMSSVCEWQRIKNTN